MVNDTRGGSSRDYTSPTTRWIAGRLRSVPTLAALFTLGGLCVAGEATANIVVVKQHNYVFATAYNNVHSISSDLLTSWTGSVSNHLTDFGGHSHTCNALLASTISADSLALTAQGWASDAYSGLREGATTQVQFQVSATRTYNIVGQSTPGSINVLRDGVIWITGAAIGGSFDFETGRTYEIDCAISEFATSAHGAYWISFTSVPVALASIDDGSVTTVKGGSELDAEVVLNQRAPAGTPVAVMSSNPNVATVPNPVTIPWANLAKLFVITTKAVKVNTPVTIMATYGGISQALTIMITP